MQIGISLPHFRRLVSAAAVRTIAQHAEVIGLDSIWVTDHMLLTDADVQRFGTVFYEPLVTLSWAAAVTTKIRIGTSAIILPYRNPKITAKQLATIDVLSAGRLIFGCAAGWSESEFRALGADFENRGKIADENLRIIKEAWMTGRVDGLVCEPEPVQKPHPPIWVGGNSKRGMRRAAEFGDAWHPTRPTADDIRAGKTHLQSLTPRPLAIAAREPFKIDERLPADRAKPFLGPRKHVMESFHEFKELGVAHFVIDLFYSVKELQDESVDSMMRAMEVLANCCGAL